MTDSVAILIQLFFCPEGLPDGRGMGRSKFKRFWQNSLRSIDFSLFLCHFGT
jgi:hypothetical protein